MFKTTTRVKTNKTINFAGYFILCGIFSFKTINLEDHYFTTNDLILLWMKSCIELIHAYVLYKLLSLMKFTIIFATTVFGISGIIYFIGVRKCSRLLVNELFWQKFILQMKHITFSTKYLMNG